MRARFIPLLALIAVTACANTDRPLRELRAAGNGPDEFAVIPQNPLQIPQTRNLPTPTPGGTNLADPNPNAEAIAALGGSAAAQRAGGIPSNDTALVAYAGRNGVDPNVRAELAAVDEAFRERRQRLNVFNPLGRDRYFPAYSGQALDASAESRRLAALGIAVPTRPTPQPQTQTRQPVETREAEVSDEDESPRLLQRAFDSLIGQIGSGEQGPDQNCVFKTVPPDNRLQRVCTPVEPEAQ